MPPGVWTNVALAAHHNENVADIIHSGTSQHEIYLYSAQLRVMRTSIGMAMVPIIFDLYNGEY